MWKKFVERRGSQKAIRRMHIAYWILKATRTQSDYKNLVGFPLQK
jgi:hypothetical protein